MVGRELQSEEVSSGTTAQDVATIVIKKSLGLKPSQNITNEQLV